MTEFSSDLRDLFVGVSKFINSTPKYEVINLMRSVDKICKYNEKIINSNDEIIKERNCEIKQVNYKIKNYIKEE